MSRGSGPPPLWFVGCAATAGAALLVWAAIRARRNRPRFNPADVLFQEWFASGCSDRDWYTRFSGANNCLRIVVTRDFVWVAPWFPFNLLAPLLDLEHVIPRSAITGVTCKPGFWLTLVLVTFTDPSGDVRCLRLCSTHTAAFHRSLVAEATRPAGF